LINPRISGFVKVNLEGAAFSLYFGGGGGMLTLSLSAASACSFEAESLGSDTVAYGASEEAYQEKRCRLRHKGSSR
jgi:hypothetical protein